ncbi:MAG: hypothetical protein IJ151_08725 [Bacteroidales bacterium]|nr:hypothetical protein [Bacteroidales bacterium]
MLEELKQNIEKLISLYEGQKAESERLSAELLQSKQTIEDLKEKNAGLERQLDNLKLTQAFSSAEGGNPAAKEKIEKLLKQLDKCIEQLER